MEKQNHRQGLERASIAIASDGGIRIAVDLVDDSDVSPDHFMCVSARSGGRTGTSARAQEAY